MQTFTIGLIFLVLFVLGTLTVWIQSDALELGYRVEEMRLEAERMHRENRNLEVNLAGMKSPSSLLRTEGEEGPIEPAAVMPEWNLVWIPPLSLSLGDLASRSRREFERDETP